MPRNNTCLWAGSIYDAHSSDDGLIQLVLQHADINNGWQDCVVVKRAEDVGRLDECPRCGTRRVAAEKGDYLCCWCRDKYDDLF